MLVSTLDTYYNQVVTQMQNVSPTQAFGGITNARDWPLTPLIFGALYLLVGAKLATGGTDAQVLYEYQCQWTWLLVGTDIQANQVAENRGDRYRTNAAIEDNLRQANFPRWCNKQSASVNASTGAVTFTGVSSVTPSSSTEQIYWTKINFATRFDNEKSGVVYGVGAVKIYGYDDTLPNLLAA